MAREGGGKFCLRIEDIDKGRCRVEFEQAILEDLAWLGLDWDGEVRRQSDHLDDYVSVVDSLADRGLIYPCFCTRSQIAAEIAQSQSAPHGPLGPVYPGSCRNISQNERLERIEGGENYSLRLNLKKALTIQPVAGLSFHEINKGNIACDIRAFGDVVIARKDIPTSYHLSVTLDDAWQEINHVVRGQDLFSSTHIHRYLQALLGLPTPRYLHHGLVSDTKGRRLAKRDQSVTIRSFRDRGHTADEVKKLIGFGENRIAPPVLDL